LAFAKRSKASRTSAGVQGLGAFDLDTFDFFAARAVDLLATGLAFGFAAFFGTDVVLAR
jgi:hypothetical protein